MDIQQHKIGFAKRFRAALERRNLQDQTDGALVRLMARVGLAVSDKTVGNWRNAKHMPTVYQVQALAKWLDIDAGDLAFGKPRIGEARGSWAQAASTQIESDELALLGAEERTAVMVVVRLLAERRARPGRKKQRP